MIRPESIVAEPGVEYVGFDLDGTLNALDAYQLMKARKFFRRSPGNPEAYDIEDKFRCSHVTRQLFWALNIWEYCSSYPAREDASDVVSGCLDLGLTPALITARVYVTSGFPLGLLFRGMVLRWLEQQNLPIEEQNIYYCSEKDSAVAKAEVCQTMKPRWMFEDKPDNALTISQQTDAHVLVPTEAYNRSLKETGQLTIIKNLQEGFEVIKSERAATC